MSMRSVFGTLSLASVLLLTACGEEDEGSDDVKDDPKGGEQDSGSKNPRADGGSDAGDDEPDADGGVSGDGGSQQGDGGDGARHFFLPTVEPDNTSDPTVEVDSAGNVHTVYPAYAGGDAYYSLCANDGSCTGSESAKVVKFETEGTVANAMLALTADGRPRVLLSTFAKVYWASCEQNCGQQASWTLSEILDHNNDNEITGEALALDPQGRPRFLMHTYRALFGIGQKAPEQVYAQCDANCENPASWRYDVVEHEIWYGSNLRIDAQGRPHVATTVIPFEGTTPQDPLHAYLSCAQNCTTVGSFTGVGFFPPYESQIEAVTMYPATSLALTKQGTPRLAMIAKSPEGKKQLLYFACDQSCLDGNNWRGILLTDHDQIDSGIDLALDANDKPRLAYTFSYNILLYYCDEADCTTENARWDDEIVEASSSIPPDDIFLWENCTIGAWFLHDPSVALTKDGVPRVAYQIRDVSGGYTTPDPTKPGCTPGTDMSLSRITLMAPL